MLDLFISFILGLLFGAGIVTGAICIIVDKIDKFNKENRRNGR